MEGQDDVRGLKNSAVVNSLDSVKAGWVNGRFKCWLVQPPTSWRAPPHQRTTCDNTEKKMQAACVLA